MPRPTPARVVIATVASLAVTAGVTAAQADSAAPMPSAGAAARGAVAKTHPMLMWNRALQFNPAAQSRALASAGWTSPAAAGTALTPPTPPCPESGQLPAPFSSCGLPEFPAVGEPYPGNMAYWGGHVQVHPKVYLVYWGWGRKHAFKSKTCKPVHLVEGKVAATLKCDPHSAGKRMADFVSQMGGTEWAGVQTQYYETVGGKNVFITNPRNQLGGIWVDDSSALDTSKYTPSTSPTAGLVDVPGQSTDDGGRIYAQMAAEAQKAVAHFHIRDLQNSDVVIAQPENFSDPAAASIGYCAFHDYTQPVLEHGWYNKIKPGISYTNMPYVYSQGAGCGANLVNSGSAGLTDGVTIALGHEIEETVTDPGAEDITPDGRVLGGWYDPFDANENGDKCAYVGELVPQPGAAANIKGNRGGIFAVQSLWSNQAAGGVGYCAGAGNDLPF